MGCKAGRERRAPFDGCGAATGWKPKATRRRFPVDDPRSAHSGRQARQEEHCSTPAATRSSVLSSTPSRRLAAWKKVPQTGRSRNLGVADMALASCRLMRPMALTLGRGHHNAPVILSEAAGWV